MDRYQIQSSPFFQSLPLAVQESVMQSGIQFQNDDEIRMFAETVKKTLS